MPASRTSNKSHRKKHPDSELVVVSSSDCDSPPNLPPRKPKILPGEVIEISDDDEPTTRQPTGQTATIADLRRQLTKQREESVKNKRDYERARLENAQIRQELLDLKATRIPDNGKILLEASQLEDCINCEICTSRMWSPFLLAGCGHIFCLSCLQDWFSTTLVQFMAANPHYDVNQPHPLVPQLQAFLQNPHALNNPQVATMLAHQLPPEPEYTCPSCRERVRVRPAEVFTLKALVRTVATAAGEAIPKETTLAYLSNKRGKAKATIPPTGPWDGFFPRIRT
ncbi:hypothetical protein K443DRAFT_671830 [Laccaria amethystina LaAM-08-1]|uniref:RING-type domain-containing protein n=1 Tax=Laccaria amethystina LaAM-08-1 TaxID=1095629 RepID=A0A0C9Y5S9_9AGAR|nr:hypothetical protein K443DRAFT_671830 [Laccaria amethystina LaAM-08-1]